ncbi:MAG: hypothetical protein E6G06_13050 [Actinobacteria bacterium]|nr:MAG: hypothetical protein E6G06_13050 [Actinomycetota bacterium]
MASRGSRGLRGLGLLATGLGLGLMAVRARREPRDHALVGTWAELSGLDAPVEEAVTDVAPGSVAEPVAPEPVVEVAPEPVVEVAPEPVADLLPERPSWEIRAKAWFERAMATARHYRRALIAVCAVALALILLVAVPAVVRTRHSDRWQRCAERTTGTSLPRGGRVTRVVLDSCGPKPAFNRVPADRRN